MTKRGLSTKPCGCQGCGLQVIKKLHRTYHPRCPNKAAIVAARQAKTNRNRAEAPDIPVEQIEAIIQQHLQVIRYRRKIAA